MLHNLSSLLSTSDLQSVLVAFIVCQVGSHGAHMWILDNLCSFLPKIALGYVMAYERGVFIAWCQTHTLHVLRYGLELCGHAISSALPIGNKPAPELL